MNESLVSIITSGILLGIILIFVLLPQSKSAHPALPKLIHKIFAVLICALFLIIGFFLGKHSLEKEDETSDYVKLSPSMTMSEYLERIKAHVRAEEYEEAADLDFNLDEVSSEVSSQDMRVDPSFLPPEERNRTFQNGDYLPFSTESKLSQFYLYRAFAFKQLKKWSLAIDDYNAAMKLAEPEDRVFFLQHRAAMYRDSRAYKAALADYNTIIAEEYPHSYVDVVDVYYGRGLVYEKLDSTEKALASYQKAQSLAYEHTPCLCYEGERVDPLACKFVDFAYFHRIPRNAAEARQQFIDELGLGKDAQSPNRPISKPKGYIVPRKSPALELVKLKSKAKNRIFPPESALAYAYYRRGRLYLKQENRDSAAHDFFQLMTLCEDKKGACVDLAELIGDENFTKILGFIKNGDNGLANVFLTDTLQRVKVKEGGWKDWRLWGVFGFGLVGLGIAVLVLHIYRRRK